MNSKGRQSGMTLIEIMIALLIGAFLLGGIIVVFISSKHSYRMQENMARLQENGRFAMEFLGRDIRMAGFWDCMAPSPSVSDVTGTEGASGAPDSIILRGAFVRTHNPADVCGTVVTAAATVTCPQATLPANFFTDNSSMVTYSISGGKLRRVTNCTTNDVVEGVENMQILYGVDTDAAGTTNYGTPNYYVAANSAWTAANWAQVVSVRITITVRTLDNNVVKAVTGNPNGWITRDFTSTIALRNRMQ